MTPEEVLRNALRQCKEVFQLEAFREEILATIDEALLRSDSPHCQHEDWADLDYESNN